MRSKSTLLIVLAVLLIFLIIGGLFVAKKKGWVGTDPSTKVAVEEVKLRDIVQTVVANGKIYPEVEVIVTPDVSGEIIALQVEEGDSVKAGQTLLRIEPELIESSVERAKAAVNTAKANAANLGARIGQLQTQLDNANRELARTTQLFNEDIVSLRDKEQAETSVLSLEAEIEAARQSLEAANFNIQSAQATSREAGKTLARTSMGSPMTGIVSSLSVEKGERVVGTSQFQGTEIMRIANYGSMELRVEVSENDVLKVSKGDSVIIEVDAYYDRTFSGKVTTISNATQSAMAALSNDQVTNYTVKIRIDSESYADLLKESNRFPFRPGMSASADIVTKVLEDAISVPTTCVTTRELEDSETEETEEVVFVIDAGKVSQVSVKSGIQDDRFVELKEGLSEGSQVVSAPYRAISEELEDGTAVKVVDRDELYGSK